MKIADDLHLFGVRHHGPGTAHALLHQLEKLAPDAILVEGPPDANALIRWLADPELEPPVALIVYRPDDPHRAAMFPFAVFSPEFQALRYAALNGVESRFIDLPQSHLLAVDERIELPDPEPLRTLSQAAGFENYERWWNQLFEQRQDTNNVFEAVLEMMQAIRDGTDLPVPQDGEITGRRLSAQREAHMRHCIRQVRAEGYCRIVVVCGAWHAPSLIDLNNIDADTALLMGLPSVKVESVWVPWTYSRLSSRIGYGAGITSPGWYHHLWQMRLAGASSTAVIIHWLSRVGALLRDEGFEASPAHVIEAVRLAEALAALRDLSIPGLQELNEASQAVLCFGDSVPMRLIQTQLIIGERMGTVPSSAPIVPLQIDLHTQQRTLRLRPQPEMSTLNLDLRIPLHLARSHLLHRLRILNIPWGKKVPARIKEGTFREVWKLQWIPELAIRVIEANIWGNTIKGATQSYASEIAGKATNLTALTQLLDDLILAELPDVIGEIMNRIADEAAVSTDILMLMKALPPLARIQRYGSVRQPDREMVGQVVDGLLARICIGLPSTCVSIDDPAAQELLPQIGEVNAVIHTLRNPDQMGRWWLTLSTLVDQDRMHGLLSGYACRLLLDVKQFTRAEATQRMERAISASTLRLQSVKEIIQAAFWIEGFLKNSGVILLHDMNLWGFLNEWINTLDEDSFISILPMLRRTFARLGNATRRQIHERVKYDHIVPVELTAPVSRFDPERAAAVIPLVKRLLGLEP